MDPARNSSAKRQKVATGAVEPVVESALFNPDVAFLVAAFLDARDLCQVSLTCKALGGRQAEYSDLSLIEEAARRLLECASDWERSCLPKYEDEGWIELYRHLLLLRSKLTFDQLVGRGVQYGQDSSRYGSGVDRRIVSGGGTALCSNHVMRSGRHLAVFTRGTGQGDIGIVRPVKVNRANSSGFDPVEERFWEYLRGRQTERWGDSNVHCCVLDTGGYFNWYDWTTYPSDLPENGGRVHGFRYRRATIELLLDLDEGTLSFCKNGVRLATLKTGLSGEYCWCATVRYSACVSIKRESAPQE